MATRFAVFEVPVAMFWSSFICLVCLAVSLLCFASAVRCISHFKRVFSNNYYASCTANWTGSYRALPPLVRQTNSGRVRNVPTALISMLVRAVFRPMNSRATPSEASGCPVPRQLLQPSLPIQPCRVSLQHADIYHTTTPKAPNQSWPHRGAYSRASAISCI